MKKNILSGLLLILSSTSFSQIITTTSPAIKTDYLKKSKKQNTIAAATFIPGALLFCIGGAISASEFNYLSNRNRNETKVKTGDALAIAGAGLMLVAIPFHFAARKNKKNSMSISIKNEPANYFENRNFITQDVPSLTIKLSL